MVKASKAGEKLKKKSDRMPHQRRHVDGTKKATSKKHGESGLILPMKMTTYTVPPPNWPASMTYLSVALVSPTLTEPQQMLIHPTSLPATPSEAYAINSLSSYSPQHNPSIQIRQITDPSHPAYPQFGLFAAKNFLPGSHIVDYAGVLHLCPQTTCATSDYDLAFLDRDASLAIDSASMGNEGRFVNDYHGIREQGPNAVFEEYYVKVKTAKGGKETWEARMGIWVAPAKLRQANDKQAHEGILKGDEICVSYGKGWWRARRSLMEQEVCEEDVDPELQAPYVPIEKH